MKNIDSIMDGDLKHCTKINLKTASEIINKYVEKELFKNKDRKDFQNDYSEILGVIAQILIHTEQPSFTFSDFLILTKHLDDMDMDVLRNFFEGVTADLIKGNRLIKKDGCYNEPIFLKV